MFDPEEHPHQRFNPLTREWVLVCPHRTKRPWLGKIESATDGFVEHNPSNTLCPGSVRSSGKVNDMYTSTYVFDNDFPALTPDTLDADGGSHPLLQHRTARGLCRVMCFHPKSNMTLPLMSLEEIQNVVASWIAQYMELSQVYVWVQIFENKGEVMGCSNPHPHCQIWASSFLPQEAMKEEQSQLSYYETHGTSMLLDYVHLEVSEDKRIVAQNNSWLVVVPYWAVWPFELLLVAKRPVQHLTDLSDVEQADLAAIMKVFLTKYDNLFKCSFPYSMGWHCAPTGPDFLEKECKHWQLHAHYYPPLLRSANVKKFLVGYEMFAQAQRDLTAEKAAAMLKNVSSSQHFKTVQE